MPLNNLWCGYFAYLVAADAAEVPYACGCFAACLLFMAAEVTYGGMVIFLPELGLCCKGNICVWLLCSLSLLLMRCLVTWNEDGYRGGFTVLLFVVFAETTVSAVRLRA